MKTSDRWRLDAETSGFADQLANDPEMQRFLREADALEAREADLDHTCMRNCIAIVVAGAVITIGYALWYGGAS